MKISNIMTKGVVVISTETTVQSAAELMRANDIGAIPVRKGAILEGIVTDRDIVVRVIGRGHDPHSIPVGEVMSTTLATCRENDDIASVARLMKQRKVRRVVVLDDNENPVGVVSLGDIAAHHEMKVAAETLGKVSEPVHSR